MNAGAEEVLASFVPVRLRQRFAGLASAPTEPASERIDAAVFFADISGFTKLTEQLAQRGPNGAEELTAVLNSYFERLIALITAHGGDVMKFAGDGLLAFWSGAGLALSVQRAARCALLIHAELNGYRATDEVTLSIHSGIGAGEVSLGYIGGERDRWELLIGGEPLSQMGRAAGHAGAGEVALSPRAWALLGSAARGHRLESGDWVVASVDEPPPFHPPAAKAVSAQALAPFVAAAVRRRIGAGQGEWLGELRRVTILFLNLPELTEELPLQQVHEAMRALQRTLYRFEGSVAQLGADDKGVTLLAALGLPPLMHEDDAWRGVQAARALQAELKTLGLGYAMGLSTGRVFCGVVGSPLRRQYTVMGDPVNLAARLMQGAHADILCDETTAHAAAGRIGFEALPPRRMKGKAEPVPVFRPLAEARAQAARGVMVGREWERAALVGALEKIAAGEGSCWVVEGEPGIGKSCLLRDFQAEAEARGIGVLLATGDAIDRSTPLHAWRGLFTGLFGLAGLAEGPARAARIHEAMARHPDMERLAPLLAEVLAVPMLDTEVTLPMTGQVRADNLNDLLTHLLQDECAARPTAVMVEDGHWLDSASWGLAAAVLRYVRPVLLLISTRPMPDPFPECRRVLEDSGLNRLRLEPLTTGATAELICQRLGIHSLPPELIRRVGERSQGNPFFSEELARALRESGVLRVENGEGSLAPGVDLAKIVLPESVQGAITGRIDRLAPEEQLALKVASVIGRTFGLEVLSAIYPVATAPGELERNLETLERLELTPREPSFSEVTWLFRHVITQEVAYNLMLFAQRRQLHHAAARWYERTHAGNLDPFTPLLAHHWHSAEEWARAIDCYEAAATQALQSGAYEEAATFLDTALTLSSRLPAGSIEAARRGRWHRQLGEAHIGLGDLQAAQAHANDALALLGVHVCRTPLDYVGGFLKEIALQIWHRLRPADLPIRQSRTTEDLLQIARAYDAKAQIAYYAGDVVAGVHAALASLNAAGHVGACTELANASAMVSYALLVAMMPGIGRYYVQQSFRVLAQIDDPHAEIWVLELTGMFCSASGDWPTATDRLTRAMAITGNLGDWRRWEECTIQLSMVHFYCGDALQAHALAKRLQARTFRNRRLQAQRLASCLLAMICLRLGRVAEAREALAQAPTLEQWTIVERIWWAGDLVSIHVAEGRRDLAKEEALRCLGCFWRAPGMSNNHFEAYAAVADFFVEEAGQTASRANLRRARQAVLFLSLYARAFRFARPRARQLRGRFLALRGKPAEAVEVWQEGLALAEAMEMQHEQAWLHLCLAGSPALEAAQKAEHKRLADQISRNSSGLRPIAMIEQP
jgi:class 3 adenylate cyclase/tetratricopeptide (TPR) repeat protein